MLPVLTNPPGIQDESHFFVAQAGDGDSPAILRPAGAVSLRVWKSLRRRGITSRCSLIRTWRCGPGIEPLSRSEWNIGPRLVDGYDSHGWRHGSVPETWVTHSASMGR